MQTMSPKTTLDPRFSSEDASPTDWAAARDRLRDAKTYQLTTVRADRRPHQTTIAGVWVDEIFSFTTSSGEQKAHNREAGNRHVIVTAGNSGWEGMDVILEGEAVDVTDPDRLGRLVDAYRDKYDDWSASASSTASSRRRALSVPSSCTTSGRARPSGSPRAIRSARPAGGSDRMSRREPPYRFIRQIGRARG
jgi:hypothetical protein